MNYGKNRHYTKEDIEKAFSDGYMRCDEDIKIISGKEMLIKQAEKEGYEKAKAELEAGEQCRKCVNFGKSRKDYYGYECFSCSRYCEDLYQESKE